MSIRLWSRMSEAERAVLVEEVRAWIGERSIDEISWKGLAREFSLSNAEAIHRILDPAWGENRSERTKLRRAGLVEKHRKRNDGSDSHFAEKGPAQNDIAARLAEIPPDTRSLTAYLMGDPIPGDRRRANVKGQGGSL